MASRSRPLRRSRPVICPARTVDEFRADRGPWRPPGRTRRSAPSVPRVARVSDTITSMSGTAPTVEIVGWAAPQETSEIVPARGPLFDPEVLRRTAQVHEASGFDRVLIGYFTNAPDGFIVGTQVAAATERLGLLVAHRPGFVAPTLAARKLATLDVATGGRAAVHIIAGGNDADQARDGDYADHDARYRRSAEYVDVLRKTWSSREPFDHHGEFYRVDHALSAITPVNGCVDPDLRRRRLRRGHRRPRPADRHVHGLGRAARRHGRVLRPRARRPRGRRRAHPDALQRVDPSDPRRHRGCRLGPGAGDPRRDPVTDRRPRPPTGQRRLAAPARQRGAQRGVRPLPVDAARRGHRRAGQLDGARRHAGDRRPGDGRLRRPRRDARC